MQEQNDDTSDRDLPRKYFLEEEVAENHREHSGNETRKLHSRSETEYHGERIREDRIHREKFDVRDSFKGVRARRPEALAEHPVQKRVADDGIPERGEPQHEKQRETGCEEEDCDTQLM